MKDIKGKIVPVVGPLSGIGRVLTTNSLAGFLTSWLVKLTFVLPKWLVVRILRRDLPPLAAGATA